MPVTLGGRFGIATVTPRRPIYPHMPSHLYRSRITKVRWFARRFGWTEIALKPLRSLLAPIILPGLNPESFVFRGRTHSCFFARYNMTWVGERMVEIPIGRVLLENSKPGPELEVGNVLSHYGPVKHEIVDKFERGAGVINTDILEFKPGRAYRLILSISTFEHIGFDDEAPASSGEKIAACVAHCRRLLTPDGAFVATFPTGYNPDLDALLNSGSLGCRRIDCLARIAARRWEPCTLEEAMKRPYRSRFPYGNALVVAEFGPL